MKPLQYALRSLLRARGFSVAASLTIALAIGAGCAVFTLVNAVLLRPLPYRDSGRLVGLWHTLPGLNIPLAKLSPGTYTVYRESSKSFDDIGLYVSLAATLTYPSKDVAPERVRLGWVTPSTLTLLGVKPLRGRLFADRDVAKGAPGVAIISERLWQTRFGGNERVLDQTIDVDGQPFQIVGVMPRSFDFPDAGTPIWAAAKWVGGQYAGSFGYDGIGRLRPGATLESTQRELDQLVPRVAERFSELRPGVSTSATIRQSRLSPVVHRLRDDVIVSFDRVLWLIAGAVGLLLVVAFSNVASLLLVRIEARQREFATYRALGASVWDVLRYLVVESALVAVVGGTLGVGLAALALGLIVRAGPLGVPRVNEVHVDAALVIAAVALTTLFVAMSAVIGFVRVGSESTLRVLREAGRTGTSGIMARRLRAAFVVVEVALSLVLLAGAGVLGRSAQRLRAVQPGFDPSNTFTFWTFLPAPAYPHAPDAARFYREIIDRIQRLPGVESAAATNKLPLEIEGFPYRILIWADEPSSPPADLPPVFQTPTTTSGYFSTMRIPFLAGRSYDDANVRRGAHEAVVSRSFVEHFWQDSTGRSGVGKRLRPNANGAWFTIVGVVGEVRDSTLTQAPIPEVYFPEEPTGDTVSITTARDMAIVVRTQRPMADLPARLRGELHAVDPNLPFYRPAMMDQVVADARGRLMFALTVLGVGAGATLLLGVIGLYGVIAYVVSLRSREISLRIALGLQPDAAARLVLGQGEVISIGGIVLGLGVFLGFAKLLSSLAFGVDTLDVATLAAATALVLVIATLATWIPARAAARVNPAEALKND